MRQTWHLRGPILVTLAAMILGTGAWNQSVTSPDPENLIGTWNVDLRPTPDAEPYLQKFEVTSVSEEGFEGEFYGTPLEEGRLNLDWGAVRFAFVTADGSGNYHHAGILRDGRMEGTTHSLGRDFLAYWTATRD
jgi:hypothetical protein